MTDVQRSYCTNLLTAGRATMHALDHAIRWEHSKHRREALATQRTAVAADVTRLELVLGV